LFYEGKIISKAKFLKLFQKKATFFSLNFPRAEKIKATMGIKTARKTKQNSFTLFSHCSINNFLFGSVGVVRAFFFLQQTTRSGL